MKEAVHLVRLAALLVAAVAVFALVREAMVPAGFGRYGHYRAGALADAQAHPIVYAGRAACGDCHGDALQALRGSRHGKIGCEACHGPLAGHAAAPERVTVKLPGVVALCTGCHEKIAARPKTIPQVVSREHSGGESCKSCHQPHNPKVGG
ncbi:MAG TPA: hypothetical protein DEH78_09385 [Solibacterales bacterium]|nr:hypothetical protein [Bryobacterales bacterium]